jgi:hypothetical protein
LNLVYGTWKWFLIYLLSGIYGEILRCVRDCVCVCVWKGEDECVCVEGRGCIRVCVREDVSLFVHVYMCVRVYVCTFVSE